VFIKIIQSLRKSNQRPSAISILYLDAQCWPTEHRRHLTNVCQGTLSCTWT